MYTFKFKFICFFRILLWVQTNFFDIYEQYLNDIYLYFQMCEKPSQTRKYLKLFWIKTFFLMNLSKLFINISTFHNANLYVSYSGFTNLLFSLNIKLILYMIAGSGREMFHHACVCFLLTSVPAQSPPE